MQALDAGNAVPNGPVREEIFLTQRRKGESADALLRVAREVTDEESPHDQPEKDFRTYRNVIDLPSECGCGCGGVCAGLANLAAAWIQPNVIF